MGSTAPRSPSVPDRLLDRYRFDEPVHVMRPTLPDREAYTRKLEEIWDNNWLTNDGPVLRELGAALSRYLGAEHLSLCCNGTVGLLMALLALRIRGGDVITTPFTSPATTHSLFWNGVRPVFCDIDPETFNLDPRKIEERLTPETRALLPVHVFGYPCDMEAIQEVADKHGLPVIYDAAHMVGVRTPGRSYLDYGDVSVLSFHATKIYTTVEGGAVAARSESVRRRLDDLRKLGYEDAETIVGPGINGKMNELEAAFGLFHLEVLEDEIARRRDLTALYRDRLKSVPGLWLQDDLPGVRHNYSYMPVLVDPDEYGMDRDVLHRLLQPFNVHARKYFHPLCSRIPCYASLPSAHPEGLPVAERVASRVLCLPLYGTLEADAAERICAIIGELHRAA